VQITFTHPRVQKEVTPPRVVLPTTTNITVPNSHQHIQPTPCRAVIPSILHTMISRSTSPQNLSDDMLAETVQHANHVLSLPTGPAIKTAKSAIKNEPMIVMP
jgi:hypothetical protein